MTEIDQQPFHNHKEISKEEVTRLLDLGRLLKSVLTEDELNELRKEIPEIEKQE